MRWYFAIDTQGGLGETGALARLAVLSAQAVGGLEPVLLYYGERTAFTDWMLARGVRIVDVTLSFMDFMNAAITAGTYRPHSMGHWLRVAVPQVEQEHEFVLYTDCDVLFLRAHDFSRIKPKLFAAAPEFSQRNWRYFNSGVMVLNVPAMRATYPAFEGAIKLRIAEAGQILYDDQIALNEVYREVWDRLDPLLNWKPYWAYAPNATILHFHGPKPNVLAAIAAGQWHNRDDTAIFFERMLNARLANYLAWSRVLEDFLQGVDFPAALEFNRLSSALTRYQRARAAAGLAEGADEALFEP